jgi:large conductance mechanosensitive channel
MSVLKGFKDFLLRGNVVDLAVAVVVGAAFAGIVTSFTKGVIQPVINVFGSTEKGWGYSLKHTDKAVEAATFIDIGGIVTAVINFTITAAVVYFLFILPMNKLLKLRKSGAEPEVEATPEDIALLQEIRDLLKTLKTRGGAV